MGTTNPFLQQMVKMKLPPGMGSQVCLAGFSLDADENNCVEIPRSHKAALESHGLVEVVATAQADGKRK